MEIPPTHRGATAAATWIFRGDESAETGACPRYLKNYTHWAFGDVDVLVGDLGRFLDADELQAFDVVSYSFGDNWRAYARGQWTLHRNGPRANVAYANCPFLSEAELESRLRRGAHYESAEGCYSTALKQAKLRFKIVTKHFTDATQHGDADAAWLAEGEIRRCGGDAAARRCRPLAPRSPPRNAWNPRPWERVELLPPKDKRCMSWVNPACGAGVRTRPRFGRDTEMGRGDAAAATRMVRGGGSTPLRRGLSVETGSTPRPRRGYSAEAG